MQLINMKDMHPEVRAFIYQQLADLERFLPAGSNVSVLINDESDRKKTKRIAATIRIQTPFGELKALGETGDVFQSLREAKTTMIKQLGEMHRMATEQDRTYDISVETIIKKNHLH